MYSIKKKKQLIYLLLYLAHAVVLTASDTITITAPAESSTVTGKPLSITGTSSQAGFTVRITINTTVTAFVTTDGGGNWSYSAQDLNNGNYTITADLLNGSSVVTATDTNTFTIVNAASINIIHPVDEDIEYTNQFTVSGISSAASATVNVSIDGTLTATTTTDASGNWTTIPFFATPGSHTILAELVVASVTVASDTVTATGAASLTFPAGKKQIRIVNGSIPTSGSGTGSGFSYIVSGSTATITFTPAFTAIPVFVATGSRASGMSTITIVSIGSTAANIAWSTGTTTVNFIVTLIS